MRSTEHTVRYTAAEIEEMRRRGEDRTDFARLDRMTEPELEAAIDQEEEGEFAWSTARAGIPQLQRTLTLRVDADLIDWFEAQGPGYQSRINAVLRSFVDTHRGQQDCPG